MNEITYRIANVELDGTLPEVVAELTRLWEKAVADHANDRNFRFRTITQDCDECFFSTRIELVADREELESEKYQREFRARSHEKREREELVRLKAKYESEVQAK